MNADPFVINGRFLSQRMTGVQRYALNVVKAIDVQSGLGNAKASIVAPPGAVDPQLTCIPMTTRGSMTGPVWEQTILPLYSRCRLLNLCNTAPIWKADQIVCIHDANIFASPESYSRKFRAYYQMLQPLLVRRAARIVTVSEAAARQIARHLPVAAEDIAVIPNGYEHALEWNPNHAQLAPAFINEKLVKSDRPFVLALGSRAAHKNIELLMSAAAELDGCGINIIVAGGSSHVFAANTEREQSNVSFLGHVTDDDLAYLLDRALCLAFPSLTEGFGIPIVEAMGRGCPVIASDCASMPEVCGDAALLVSPFDRAAWVKSIRALQKSPHLRDELIGSGHQQVKKFTWSGAADAYLNLLEEPEKRTRSHTAPSGNLPATTVVIATRGRPEIVTATVRHLLTHQTLKPVAVILSCVELSDAGELINHPQVTVMTGPAGLAAQRNTALQHIPSAAEIVAFFDDDFIADKNWLAVAAATFRDESGVVGFTGRVVADGITGPGISFEEAARLVETAPPADWQWIDGFSPYGCNMAFRLRAIGSTRFDERLVLYGWLEDRDFGAALAKKGGRFVKVADAFGVHMGTKSGRVTGERFGYSQVINPIYMFFKGTMSAKKVLTHIGANAASNFGRLLTPEPFVDRRGRARGNLLAVLDLMRGRLEPERALTVTPRVTSALTHLEVKPR